MEVDYCQSLHTIYKHIKISEDLLKHIRETGNISTMFPILKNIKFKLLAMLNTDKKYLHQKSL